MTAANSARRHRPRQPCSPVKRSNRLRDLIARYADPAMPYEVKRRRGPFARAYDYDEYEHLARVKEWLTQEAEEEFR